MNIFLNMLLLVVGFILLIKGADIFVDGASSSAQNFKVSKMLIGLTIVAFGTSAPELAVSISALASGSSEMVLGNVIGSNILNILLILGIAAVVRPIRVKDNTVKKEIPLAVLLSVLVVVLFLDKLLGGAERDMISREDGIVLLLFFSVFLYYLVGLARQGQKGQKDTHEKPKYGLVKSLLLVGGGMVGIILGSQVVVNSATAIAEAIGVTERVIALSVVALGTSLPELVTSVVAARKGEQDLAVGNVIGSNIFNICIVLGVPVVMFGAVVPDGFQVLDLVMLIVSVVLLFLFSMKDRQIKRWEGVVMLMLFAAYYSVVMIA